MRRKILGKDSNLRLPEGYYLIEEDDHVIIVCDNNDVEIAKFSSIGADPREVEREAWNNFNKK